MDGTWQLHCGCRCTCWKRQGKGNFVLSGYSSGKLCGSSPAMAFLSGNGNYM